MTVYIFEIAGRYDLVEVEADDMIDAIKILAKDSPGVYLKKFIGQYEEDRKGTA